MHGTRKLRISGHHDHPFRQGHSAWATYAVTEPDGGRLWIAQYRNVDVLEVSDSYLSANFEVTFTHGELTGFFTALGCTDWARSASVPALVQVS